MARWKNMSLIEEPDPPEEPAVQVLILTIDGKQFACLGPVIHVPSLGLVVEDVQSIEFGEVLPASLAAQMIDGTLRKGDEVQ